MRKIKRTLRQLYKMHDFIIGDTNETYEMIAYTNLTDGTRPGDQTEGENIDKYVADLKDLTRTCNFCSCADLKDSLLRDRIALGVRDDQLKKEMLQKRKLSLEEAIDHC